MGKITLRITFDKKLLYVILVLVAFFASFSIALAVFSRSEGWHPLKQITNDTQGTKSVDANENGIIDYAERIVAGWSGTFIVERRNFLCSGQSQQDCTATHTYSVQDGTIKSASCSEKCTGG